MHFGDLQFLFESSIDPVRKTYAPSVFADYEAQNPRLRSDIHEQIHSHILLIEEVAPVKRYFIKGSILTKQYNEKADIDVFVQIKGTGCPRLEERIQEVWEKIDGIYAKNTTHPLQYYITTQDYDLGKTEAAYDVKNNKWLSNSPPRELEFSKYADELKSKLTRLDVGFGELKRDIIDYNVLQSIPPEQLDGVDQKIRDKIKEVEYDIDLLINAYSEIKDARNDAFGLDMSPDDIAEYGRKTHMPGNVIFKFIERYHYLDMLRKIRKGVQEEHTSMPGIEDIFNQGDIDEPDIKDKFRSDGTPRARHMTGMTGINRSTGQNLIPDIHKADPNSNNKVDLLLNKQAGHFVLNGDDVKGIVNTFRVTDLSPMTSKRLGNTGITIYYDRNLKNYCIKK
jgi:predicted nucleotidyltransferase|tara:strand:+ start:418 stop:1602 length:1185 start_codon:yes stop_codon:yes gene_type:complete